eukprot:8141680-Alexandrium_andersonii.AAC.1
MQPLHEKRMLLRTHHRRHDVRVAFPLTRMGRRRRPSASHLRAGRMHIALSSTCLLYTSDAADDM